MENIQTMESVSSSSHEHFPRPNTEFRTIIVSEIRRLKSQSNCYRNDEKYVYKEKNG